MKNVIKTWELICLCYTKQVVFFFFFFTSWQLFPLFHPFLCRAEAERLKHDTISSCVNCHKVLLSDTSHLKLPKLCNAFFPVIMRVIKLTLQWLVNYCQDWVYIYICICGLKEAFLLVCHICLYKWTLVELRNGSLNCSRR